MNNARKFYQLYTLGLNDDGHFPDIVPRMKGGEHRFYLELDGSRYDEGFVEEEIDMLIEFFAAEGIEIEYHENDGEPYVVCCN